MYTYQEPYSIKDMKVNAALVAAVDNVPVKGRKFLLANTGAQPLYFKEKAFDGIDCTAANGMLVPANSVFPVNLTAMMLSLISNATGTSYTIMYLDM